MTEEQTPRFPWWIVLGGLVLALGYLPTLTAPFDFIDDGNLVYPAPAETTIPEHVGRWWDRVRANVEHLGPFRPVLWVHWEVMANTLDADPVAWRAVRLVWCGLAAVALLWLLRELNVAPTAALLAGAAAMWNPYRNEIWTSLTLAEGVAMPYALLALIGARKASGRLGRWDAAAVFGLVMALGCKNTFAALVPAMAALRLWPDGVTLRDGWRANRWRAAAYLLQLVVPAVHFVYFKLNWHPGQYETAGPTLAQLGRMASWLKGAAGLDFLGLGVAAVIGVVVWDGKRQRPPAAAGGLSWVGEPFAHHRAALLCSALLLLAGVTVYLPLPMMAARYTMPAVWGGDIALAVLLTRFVSVPAVWPRRCGWAAVGLGLAVMMVANVGRQEKVAARARTLWAALHHLEATAPPNARLAWVSGDDLNAEEGIHFAWHLLHRGRPDIRIGLVDEAGRPVERVELPPLDGEPQYRLTAAGVSGGWAEGPTFATAYRFGRKRFVCRLDTVTTPAVPPTYLDPWTMAAMKAGFENPGGETDQLQNLTAGTSPQGKRPTVEANPKKEIRTQHSQGDAPPAATDDPGATSTFPK